MVRKRLVQALGPLLVAVALIGAAPASAAVPQRSSQAAALVPLMIRNVMFVECLGIDTAPTSCSRSGNWFFQPHNTAVNSYKLVAQAGADNSCLEQYPPRSPHLRLAWCGSTGLNQVWIPQSQADPPGVYNRLVNQDSGQCLDMSWAMIPTYPFPTPTAVTAWDCAPGVAKRNQLWYWLPRR